MTLKKYKKRQLLIQYFFRKKYFKKYFLIFLLKFLLTNNFISKQTKVLSTFYYIKLQKTALKTYHKNICLFSGHKRSVSNFLKLHRMSAIEKTSNLFFPGVTKAVW